MTRILTVIALLFATPAWAGKIEDAGDFSLICSAEDEGHKELKFRTCQFISIFYCKMKIPLKIILVSESAPNIQIY